MVAVAEPIEMAEADAAEEIVFTLSDNNLREGGRPRDPLAAYLNVDATKRAYLGVDLCEPIPCLTDDGEPLDCYISGLHGKNFRSHGEEALGNWLKLRCRAMPGDQVYARWEEAPSRGRVLRLRYVRQYVPHEAHTVEYRRLERETEEGVAAALKAAGIPVQRQVRVPSGVIDVLTPDAIYEVKTYLDRADVYAAIGQLMVYSTEEPRGTELRKIIVGRETRETAALIPTLAKLGIEVELWQP